MRKKCILNGMVGALIVVILAIMVISLIENKNLREQVEQREIEVEALQQQNATMDDTIWNLHQHLTKLQVKEE